LFPKLWHYFFCERNVLPSCQFSGLCSWDWVNRIRFLDQAVLHSEGFSVFRHTRVSIFGVTGSRIDLQAVHIVFTYSKVSQKCYAAYVLRCHHQMVQGIRWQNDASFVVTTGVWIGLYPFHGMRQCAVLCCLQCNLILNCSFKTSTDAPLVCTDTI
jgi:hypothetical protein